MLTNPEKPAIGNDNRLFSLFTLLGLALMRKSGAEGDSSVTDSQSDSDDTYTAIDNRSWDIKNSQGPQQ